MHIHTGTHTPHVFLLLLILNHTWLVYALFQTKPYPGPPDFVQVGPMEVSPSTEKPRVGGPVSIRRAWAFFQAWQLLDFFPMEVRMC